MTQDRQTSQTRASLPWAEIIHEMPGRSRLRVESRQGDAVFFAATASGLSSIAGVRDVGVTPFTGSILIRHSADLSEICAAAKEAGLFELKTGVSEAEQVPPAEPKTIIALGLCVMAVWQIAKGRGLSPATTLLWYAGHLGGVWNNTEVAGRK